jgi:hypothetical protein
MTEVGWVNVGRTMSISALLQEAAFTPETTELLARAFETAWRTVETSGRHFGGDGHAEAARLVLAKRIIELAGQGERDENRLVQEALLRLADSAQ